MIVHAAFFRWKPRANAEDVETFLRELRRLPGEIPGIVALTDGRNFAEGSPGFDHGVTVHFADRASREAYDPHPAHERLVKEFLIPVLGDAVEVDYEDLATGPRS